MTRDRGLRVLLVEDNPGERWLFAEILRSRGHTVTACEDAETALRVWKEEPFPLILLDWLLPGMDGFEFCRTIRDSPAGSRCVMVVVTGRQQPKVLEEVLDAGADDYIHKPVEVGLLNIRLAVAEREVAAIRSRTRTEEALEATTRELRTLFDNLDDVLFSIDMEERRLIQISPACERVFGIPPDELLEDPERWPPLLVPESLDRLEAELADLPSGDSLTVQYAVEGDADAPRWIETTYKPAHGPEGALRVDGLAVDVTARRRAEDEIGARHQELLTLYRISEVTLAAPSLKAGYDEILREVSRATGFPIATIEHYEERRDVMVVVASRGIPLPADGSPLEIPAQETVSGAVVRTGRVQVEGDVRARREHTSDVLLNLNLRAYLALPMVVSGKVAGVLTLAHTEARTPDPRLVRWAGSLANYVASFLDRMRAEEALKESEQEYRRLASQLQQANQELESFTYSISHDLRAPLRTMQGFAHTLLQDFGDELPEEARDYARRIIRSGRQAEALIRDLLSYSRLSFEDLELTPVDVAAAVRAALEQVQGDITEAGAQVEVAEDLPRALAHHTTLVQVLTNLLSNAVKFVEDGKVPRVRIGADERDAAVRIWVEDNGIGIPPDQEERIFRTFERLSEGSHRPGTGIGLAIVRRGMERIGGRAGVESVPGRGSRFWVDCPRTRERGRRPEGGRRREG